MQQSRFRSKAAWASLFSLIGLCLASFGIYDRIGMTSETWQALTTALLATLAAFGVLEQPNRRRKFLRGNVWGMRGRGLL